jgi:hypothetical protein
MFLAMPLSGTFDVLNFTEVLHLMADHQFTGRLHARTRAFNANLFFEDGQLVGADQSEHQVAAVSGDVWGRLEETCFELLDAERGSFEFHPGSPSSATTQRLAVDKVLERASTRLQEWHALQALIPSLDLQPRLVFDLSQAEVTLDRDEWRMLTLVDGRRNLRAIGRTLNMSDFDVCRMCRRLMDHRIIELEGRAAAIAAAATDADLPPVTETVTTVSGRQAVRASAPTADVAGAPGSRWTQTVRTLDDPDGKGTTSPEESRADRSDKRGDNREPSVGTADPSGQESSPTRPGANLDDGGPPTPAAGTAAVPTTPSPPAFPPPPAGQTGSTASSPVADANPTGEPETIVIDDEAEDKDPQEDAADPETSEHRRGIVRIRSRRGQRKSDGG